jgi:hypothetical protein
MWEEAANEAFFKENAAFVKCPGCKVVFEKVMGVLPPGVALTGVPELDRTAPFIELDNEGRRLSRSAMCHKATNRFRCRMCATDFCGACMEFPYHLGRSCEEVADEKTAAKCLFCEALLRDARRWSDDKDLSLRYVHLSSCRSCMMTRWFANCRGVMGSLICFMQVCERTSNSTGKGGCGCNLVCGERGPGGCPSVCCWCLRRQRLPQTCPLVMHSKLGMWSSLRWCPR